MGEGEIDRLALDARRETLAQRRAFEKVRRAERYFAAQLRKLARHIGDLVQMYDPADPSQTHDLIMALQRYADVIRPWAAAVSGRLLREVARRDQRAWRAYTRLFGLAVQQEITSTPIGAAYRQLMAQQVHLITSLPLDAAQRVHELAMASRYEGGRAGHITEAIMQTGLVARSRADLIAVTETARAASAFQQVRAQSIGSEEYQWLTARDQRVRPLHRKLEGRVFRWDDPPIIGEDGERGHPGTIYRCRCVAAPILPAL